MFRIKKIVVGVGISAALLVGLAVVCVVPDRVEAQSKTVRQRIYDDCVTGIRDVTDPRNCLLGNSTPALGMLYPISQNLFVDTSGKVGIGTVTPNESMTVEGVVSLREQGSAPAKTDRYGKIYAKKPGGAGPNTKLLLHADGPNGSTTFIDSSISQHIMRANGNVHISTTKWKFGGASALFDGVGDFLTTPSGPDFNFGSDAFTIDFWCCLEPTAQYQYIYTGGADLTSIGIEYNEAGTGKLHFFVHTSGPTWANGSFGTQGIFQPSANIWFHYALVRNGDVFTQYIDGDWDATWTATNNMSVSNSVNDIMIGDWPLLARSFDGYMDEFRISKGVARWLSDFEPPTIPYSGGAGLFYMDAQGNEFRIQLAAP